MAETYETGNVVRVMLVPERGPIRRVVGIFRRYIDLVARSDPPEQFARVMAEVEVEDKRYVIPATRVLGRVNLLEGLAQVSDEPAMMRAHALPSQPAEVVRETQDQPKVVFHSEGGEPGRS